MDEPTTNKASGKRIGWKEEEGDPEECWQLYYLLATAHIGATPTDFCIKR